MTAKDLKNAILQEAVQGKLVPQIASEGNAWDLLEEIKKERLSHGFANSYGICGEKGKKSKSSDLRSKSQIRVIKKSNVLPEITEDEIPFDIPESWCWCRLGELITFVGGYAYDSHSFIDKSDYQVLRLGNVKNGYLQLSAKPVFINAELAEKTNAFKCITNDILVTMTGTRLKRDYFFTTLVTKYDENLYINQRVGCLRPTKFIFANFLAWILKSKPILDYIFEFETGTANQGNLGSENIKTIPIPLPPLAEQKRIVAAIEKFMPLIEEYGKKETQLKALNEQIGVLTKKAILQEAVQGKLVPQIAAEGNAKDLLEEIKKEKAKLIKEGKIKKEKPLPEISDDEIPFDIPENWCWCRLGEIMYIWSARRVHQSDWKNQGIPFYRAREIGKLADFGYVDNELFISEELYNEYVKTGIPEENDLMITAVGTLGKAYIVKKDDHFYYKDASVISFKNFGRLNSSYLKIIMDSVFMQEQIKNTSSGTTVGTITIQNANHFLIPLPPLAEQKRIVAAIEKMLSLCEKLGV